MKACRRRLEERGEETLEVITCVLTPFKRRALITRLHDKNLRSLTLFADQETRQAGHLPALLELPFGGFQYRELNVSSYVENYDLDISLASLIEVTEHGLDMFLVSSVVTVVRPIKRGGEEVEPPDGTTRRACDVTGEFEAFHERFS